MPSKGQPDEVAFGGSLHHYTNGQVILIVYMEAIVIDVEFCGIYTSCIDKEAALGKQKHLNNDSAYAESLTGQFDCNDKIPYWMSSQLHPSHTSVKHAHEDVINFPPKV